MFKLLEILLIIVLIPVAIAVLRVALAWIILIASVAWDFIKFIITIIYENI